MPEGAGGEVCQAIFGTCGILSIGCVTFPFGYRLRLQQGNRFFWDFDGLVGYENQYEGIYLPVQFNHISRQEYIAYIFFRRILQEKDGNDRVFSLERASFSRSVSSTLSTNFMVQNNYAAQT